MLLLTADETRHLLPFGALATAIDAMLVKLRMGQTRAPLRTAVALANDGVLLIMPASDDEFACVKTVTVHPQNPTVGLPSIHGAVLLMAADSGKHLAAFDGPTLTAHRTAALSLLGAQKLIGKPKGSLLIVGAGAQAAAHARAFWTEGKLDKIYLTALDATATQRLATQLIAEGLIVECVENAQQVIDQVNIVVTVTTSLNPVISNDVASGTLVIAVGGFRPDMSELPKSLVQRSRIFVDTLDGTKAEAGELIQANINWDEVTPLENIAPNLPLDDRPMIFKTVGLALWDLAAAELAYARLPETVR